MADVAKPSTRDGFSIAVICAIREERDAVMAMLDETWEAPEYGKIRGDDNTYGVGRIGRHKVVVIRLPGIGPREAANSAATFRSSFPNITLGLVVGICGGVPTESDNGHIVMGDVVLSKEILDFTFIRQYDNKAKIKDTLADSFGRPNREIRTFLATMEGKQDRSRLRDKSFKYLIEFCMKDDFRSWKFPGADKDIVYPRTYRHKHQLQSDDVCTDGVCAECRAAEDELNKAQADGKADEIKKAERQVEIADVCDASEKKLCDELGCDISKAVLRESQGRDPKLVDGMMIRVPEIHFGTIGSGNSVMKSGYRRDELAKERNIIAFEMEGAGVWDNFPTVVIKAVCDYADSHKRKEWQKYASGCAAACMKAFLMEWTAVDEPYRVNVPNDYSQKNLSDPQNDKCLEDLRTTNPRDDKKRIEEMKGGLLRDSYRWILENSEFQQWRDDKQSRMLWIRGDPGKGKTMLLCGIIDEFKATASAASASGSCLLSYFFCQATDDSLNSATAVLRGLIYLLTKQQPALLQHVRVKYDDTGKALFVDKNSWFALSEIFINILHDPSLKLTYLIIDALDECVKDLQLLSILIVKTSSISGVKWLLSSRNKPDIERGLRLKESQRQLSLELKENADQVSRAVDVYIDHYLSEMTIIERVIPNQNQLRDTLQRKSEGTFLWVALVIHKLRQAEDWEVWDIVNEAPAGLANLYLRMIEQIRKQDRGKPELCQCVLSAVTTTYRPLHVTELGVLAGLPPNISSSYDAIATIVKLCGSFLTIRDQVVYTIHQSAQDFLSKEGVIFPSRLEYVHYDLFSRSLQAMLKILRRDIYGLRTPGILIDQIQQPDPDPLAAVRYSCLYWVDHLLECQREDVIKDLKDRGLVNEFLSQYFLYWIEALSLLKSVSEGVVMIRKLEDLQFNTSLDLSAFLHDAGRFAVYNRSIIEQAPLQAYCSALVFAPEKSIVREAFESCIPLWIQTKPRVETNWNAMLQALESHTDSVSSVTFSPDGKQIVSGSWDRTVRRWDAATGQQLLPALEGHTDSVSSVAFSPDGKQIVSGSRDRTVRRWDAATGQQLLPALEGHTDSVSSVAFSPDGKQIVSGSSDRTVRRWDAATGQQLLPALEGHTDYVSSVTFSPDGKQIVSGSRDRTVRRWDAATGQQLLPALEGHTDSVSSVAFSPDGKQIVSGSRDRTVRRWDAATGQQLLPALEGHTDYVSSVAFSPDGKQIVSGSWDRTVRRWDAATGQQQLPALEGHTSYVSSVAFSPDGKQIVSGSWDRTVRRWDAATGQQQLPALEGHTDSVSSVAFSPDGKQIVSGSWDRTVRRWDAATGQQQLPALEGHTDSVSSVAFSPDGKQIVSGSWDRTVRRWDAATGQQLLPALEGHTSYVSSVAFSPDGKQIVSGSWDRTVRRWDAATGQQLLPALEGHTSYVSSVAFSPDGKQIVSGSWDRTVRRWDAATGQQLLPALEGHTDSVSSVAFSPDGKQIVSGSWDRTVRRWDAATGQQQLPALEGHTDSVSSVAFSPDGKQIPTLHVSGNWLVEGTTNLLWLPTGYRPTCEATWGGIIALGHQSGRLSVLQLQQGPKLVT